MALPENRGGKGQARLGLIMHNGTLEPPGQRDWVLANPWPWALLGLAICASSWCAAFLSGESLSGLGLIFLFVGLLLSGVSVALRLNSWSPAYLDRLDTPWRNAALLALAVLFAALAMFSTLLVL